MTKAPVLAMPNFSLPFVLEIDACDTSIGVFLMQEGITLAFMSKTLGIKNQGLFTYEKEYLAFLMAVKQWRHHLEIGTFIICTDHESLKYLLDQRITNQIQKKGLSKLMGLTYSVHYRKGRENKAADALSTRWEEA